MHTEFDFDTPIDRSHDGSAKWARRTDAEKAAGVVPMSVADMEFRSPPAVVEAVERAAAHGIYGYTDADAAYLDAVCGWMRRRHGFSALPEWIVPENGVVPALSVAVRAFTQPGDKVLLQTPGYPPFHSAIVENGRTPVYNALKLGEGGLYTMDLDDLAQKARDGVRMMFLCSPHNPTGRIWTVEELRAVADICLRHDILLVSDEIHFDLALHGKHTVLCDAAPQMRDRCVICTAPSKTFGLAGMQLANMVIPDAALRKAFVSRMNADGYGNVSYFGYHATIAAYTQGDAWLDAMLAYVRENFAVLDSFLKENLPMVRRLPLQGTYLAWTDWRALGMDAAQLEAFVRGEAMIVPNFGAFFTGGDAGFMRLNLAMPRRSLLDALARLLKAADRRGLS